MPPSAAERFLSAVFAGKPDELFILIWSLPGKESQWFTSIKDAARTANALCKRKNDAYFGLGLSAKAKGPRQRVTAKSVVGIPGLWCDVDLAGPEHNSKKRYPADIEATRKIFEPLPKPTIIVSSGHGLHLYWLFKEPWIFDDAAERDRAIVLCQRWHQTIRAAFERHLFDIDSTFDLARILRVVGTKNFKGQHARTVEVVERDDQFRYNPDEFAEYLVEAEPQPTTKPVAVDGFTLSAQAAPPFDKFEALVSAEPKFLRSWDRQRPDLKDPSASGYDMSLASFAMMASWTDQEIIDLLIAHRRKHGDDLKLREDYYRRTVARVKQTIKTDDAGADDAEEVLAIDDAEEKRQACLDLISTRFGMTIIRIIKHKSAEPIYHIIMDGGEIALGTTPYLIDQRLLRYKIFDAINKRLPTFKPKVWQGVVDLMGGAIEEEEADEATTVDGIGRAWMQAYFGGKKPVDDLTAALADREPFVKEGRVHFFLDDFRSWVRLTTGERPTSRSLSFHLKRSGAERTTVYIGSDNNPKGDRATTASVWVAPGALTKPLI